MKPLSLTARISLLFASAAALVLLVAGVFIYRAVEQHFVEEDRHEMLGKMELIRHLVAKAHSNANLDSLAGELDDALVGHPDLSVAVVNDKGQIWFASSGAGFPRPLLDDPPATANTIKQWVQGGVGYRGMLTHLYINGMPYTVALALNIAHHTRFLDEFKYMLAMAMALAAMATATLGWAVTRQGLRPLRKVTAMTASISSSRLDERLQLIHPPAELHDLIETFNGMLDRLEDSFRRLSEFSSDIAHELRTPVSNLMTQTQVALSQPREIEAYREILHSNLEEFDRLARMISDMLFLAKADNRLVLPRREPIDMAEEVRRLFEFHEAQAAESHISLSLEGAGMVYGDRIMLQRAISNLLANAIRHAPKGGNVTVGIRSGKGELELVVENPFEEIGAEYLDRLFDRFFRLDPSRRKDAGEGTGLGLAITKSIVEAHGGRVETSWNQGRIRFSLWLPTDQGEVQSAHPIPTGGLQDK
jgi:two-component system heavy metal sensor histidine kinase CusS